MQKTTATLGYIIRIFLAIILLLPMLPLRAQNCEVDFPGIAIRSFSTSCGGSSVNNLDLGKNINMSSGDIFTFDVATVNISGKLHLDVEGSGKIIIPAGVTVNAEDFDIHAKNAGCTQANPCIFEIVVNGTLNISKKLKNEIVTLVWSGSGTVIVDTFENTKDGCMDCSPGGCPVFEIDSFKCDDDGGCPGGDFCATLQACASDNIKPLITGCPENQVVNMTGPGCSQTASWSAPTASDNCSLSSFTSSHSSGAAFPKGNTTVTYTATDAAGNIATCSFNVNVVDKVPPVITGCPEDITVNANASCQAVVNWTAPTFTDNCSGGSITPNKSPGAPFAKGKTVVTYTATDGSGNKSTCSFNVNVIDNTPPILTGCPTNITIPADASCQAVVTWTAPTISDNCSTATLSTNKTPGSTFEKGLTEVTYTATDADGKKTTCSFTVSVVDAPPSFTNCPADIIVDPMEGQTASVEWEAPIAQAPCGNVQINSTHRPGDIFPIGQTLVEYIAVTDNEEFAKCSFTVTIKLPEIIPNEVLTPDGDNKNDVWLVENIERFPDNHAIIFDRWGSVVFRANAYNNSGISWDGQNVPTGTYYYTLIVNIDGSKIEKKGFIELVK